MLHEQVLVDLVDHRNPEVLCRLHGSPGHAEADIADLTDLHAPDLHGRADAETRDAPVEVGDQLPCLVEQAAGPEDRDRGHRQGHGADHECADRTWIRLTRHPSLPFA